MSFEPIGNLEAPITDQELMAHLRLVDDEWITEGIPVRSIYLPAALDEASRITRRPIALGDYRFAVRGRASIEVEGFIAFVGAAPAASLSWSGAARLITFTGAPPETVEVRAGFQTLPPGLKAWILLRTGTFYENREADSAKVAAPNQFAEQLLIPYIARFIVE